MSSKENHLAAPFQIFAKPVGDTCNLACDYCYYLGATASNPEQPQVMTDTILEKYIDQHIRAAGESVVFFSWHGGEPMLAGIPFFRKVISLQQKYIREGMTVLNGIQTNGTLLNDEWCSFLKDERFMVGISIDGPEDLHTAFRKQKNGKALYHETLNGYQLLKKYQIPCEALCVVNAINASEPIRLYEFFKKLEVQYLTFIPLVERNGDSSVSERSVGAKAFGEFLIAVFDRWKASDIGGIKIQIFEEAIRTAFGLEHSLCIFRETCGRVPVVERNGDFYSCDHFVNPTHFVGNINETSLAELLESPNQKAFGQAKINTLPEYCRNCEVLAMCNGACPKDRFISTPDGEPGLNYLCEGYKMFFRHCTPFVDEVRRAWEKSLITNHF